jgi:DNA repair exonuclease SbcCD ATPase subunit
MKIVRLTAENVKKLRAIEIKPDGSVVQITGKNGSGKSSVLDSIFYALAGGKDLPSQPIRRGETKAHVRLDLGELIVTRRFSEHGSTLVVEGQNGARFPSPQRMLDDLIGHISFDPLAFTRMAAREQFDMLRRLVKLEVDIDALSGQNKRDFEARTDVNRRAKSLRAQANAIPVTDGLPADPINTGDLVDRIAKAGQHNADIELRRKRREDAAEKISAKRGDAEGTRERAAALRRQAEEADKQAERLDAEAAELQKRLDEAAALPEPVDAAALREELARAEQTNRQIEQRLKREAVIKDAEGTEEESERLTAAMAERDQQKETAIAAAEMPIDDLSLGDGQVLYRALPFDQASSAEQLRVSIAIAMAANPKLRVLRVKEGSLLDEDGLLLLQEMADAGDYQVWVERVDTSGRVGIVMEDGAVAGAAANPAEQRQAVEA